ncbi:MAG: class I SAM-dependent methyltransferase [Candidatus Niyogibacteria bacterium]|nr:class I SAM-dependent methyltransferase [Candidatus Niyogibacteria bacterium]
MPFLNPDDIVREAQIREGMKVADFGSGAGFRVIPLARAVGREGKVYAIDIQKEMLEVVHAKIKDANLLHAETIQGDLEKPNGSHLKNDLLDHIVIANILFQVADKSAVAREAFRVLKPKGTTSVIEWEKMKGPLGPPIEHLADKTAVKDIFSSAGFTWEKEFYAGEHHYGLLFRKP